MLFGAGFCAVWCNSVMFLGQFFVQLGAICGAVFLCSLVLVW